MRQGLGFKLIAALLIYANLLPPALLLAQTSKPAGVVSALKGEVVITRAARPAQPDPLKFKDEVFFRDRISTKEQSIARVLMGGKALITVRELSDLTITEEPGRPSLVDLAKGKIGLAVARARMSPGESIEVRTPNAVAAVRGTVIVVEVIPAAGPAADAPDYQPMRASFTGQAMPVQAPSFITNFHVLKGSIDVTSLTAPGAPPVSIGAGLSISIVGGTLGQPQPSPPSQQLVRDLQAAPQHTGTPGETNQTITTQQMTTASNLANIITGGSPIPTTVYNITPQNSTSPDNKTTSATGGGTSQSSGSSDTTSGSPSSGGFISTTGTTLTSGGGGGGGGGTPAGNPAVVTLTNYTGGDALSLSAPLGLVDTGTFTPPTPNAFIAPTSVPDTPYSATDGGGGISLSGGIGLINTTIAAAGNNIFEVNGANATIGGSALDLTSSSSITGAGTIIQVGSTLTGTSSAPLLSVNSSSITNADLFADIPGGSTLALAGPFLSATSSTLSYASNFIFLDGTLSSTTKQPLISLTSSSLTASATFTADFIEACCGTSPTLILAGPLLSATGSTLSLNDRRLIRFDGGTVTSTTPQPFISLTNSSSLNNVSSLLDGLCCDTTTVNMAGPLLSLATTSTATFSDHMIFVNSGTSLTSTKASPFIGVDNSTLTSFALLETQGTTTLGGPLFAATNNSTATATEFGVRVQGGTLTSNSSATLVSLTSNSRLTVGNDGLLDIRCCGSSVSVTGNLLDASGGGALVVGQFGVINIENGTYFLANGSGKAMFNVAGTATTAETDPDASGLVLGSDRPIRGDNKVTVIPVAGPLFSAAAATVSTNQAVKIDTALLEATAPLINLVNSMMTSNSDLVNLANQAKLLGTVPGTVPTDALVKLNNSILNVNGSLFNVAGGSYLNVVGSLASLSNASALNITGGGLLNVSGGSVVTITGPLVLFFGTGSTLTVNNSFTPTNTINGISFYQGPGATVIIMPSATLSGGTGTGAISGTGSLIVAQGAGTKVKIK